MSLEELRALAQEDEVRESEEVTESMAEEPEAVAEEEKTEDADSDDFELELEGEPEPSQHKPTKEEQLLHSLTREKRKRKEAKGEVEALKQELEELKQSMRRPPQPAPASHSGMPKFPDMYDAGIDGDRDKYSEAVANYLADINAHNSRHNQAETEQANYRQAVQAKTENLAKRAAKFATEHKVSVDRVATALELATDDIDAATGIDGALAHLLDCVGDGGERVAYHIGTNEGARRQIKELLSSDKTGLKAIAHMTRLAEKLKPKQGKQISKAPEPDQPIRGDAVSTMSAERLQAEWDKSDGKNLQKLQAIRKRARELGVKLNT